MHVPKEYGVTKDEQSRLLTDNPFATLIMRSQGGLVVEPLPLMYVEDVPALYGHVARNSDLAGAISLATEADATFVGPNSYVSPRWSAGGRRVPTWNYVVVHFAGSVEILEESQSLWALNEFARRQEAAFAEPWDSEAFIGQRGSAHHAALLSFRLVDVRIEGKAKLSQRQPFIERAAIVAGLRAEGGTTAADLATEMERHLNA